MLGIVVVTFGRVVFHEFTGWDDAFTLFENPRLNPPTLASLIHYWTRPEGGLYIPLTYTLWSALAALGMKAGLFHASSVVLHAVSAVLVYEILRELSRAAIPSLIGAMIFAVHPLQVETVAWASGTKDLLAGCLVLAGVWQYIRYARDDRSPAARRRWGTALGLFALALLAKPSAVVGPAVAGVIDVLLVRRSLRSAARALAPILVIALPLVVVARIVQTPPNVPLASPWLRPLIAADAIAFYLHKLVWPIDLGIIYARTPEAVTRGGQLYYTWMAPAAIGAALWLGWPRTRVLIAAALVFVAALLPVLGFTPFMFQIHSTVSDHYLYVPMLGVSLAAAWGAERLDRRWFYPAAAAIVLALAARSVVQLGVWRDSLALFRHTVELAPDSAVAHANLGLALASRGDPRAALPHFQRAAELDPLSSHAHGRLALAHHLLGQHALAVEHARESIRLARSETGGMAYGADRQHLILGLSLKALGRAEEALPHLRRVLEFDPNNVPAVEALARIMKARRAPTTHPP